MSNPFDSLNLPEETSEDLNKNQEQGTNPDDNNKPDLNNPDEKDKPNPENGEEQNPEGLDEKETMSNILKMAGANIEDYTDFSVTPENLANIIQTERTKEVQSFINTIKTETPELYDLMVFMDNGGSLQEFVSNYKMNQTYAENGIDANNTELHEKIVTNWYIQKSNMPYDMASKMVGMLKETNQLFTEAKRIDELSNAERQQEHLRMIEEKKREAQELQENATKNWHGIVETVSKGVLGNFVLPHAEKESFLNFMNESLKMDNKTRQFYITLPVSNDPTTLASAFFAYKKGDLNAFIDRRAAQQKVQYLMKKPVSGNPQTGNEASDENNLNPFAKLLKQMSK